jgi:RNA polymerase sigma factor (sigma-70 family)
MQKAMGGFNLREYKSIGWVYKNNQDYVLNLVKKRIGNSPDADDLVADVFASLLEQRGPFSDYRKIRHFLYSTARNICGNYLRHQKVVRSGNDEIAGNSQDTDEESWYAAETAASFRHLVYEAIEKLPQKNKQVFLLYFSRDLKNEEIARELGLSDKTVANRKALAIKMLKMELLKMGGYLISLLYFVLC